MVLACMSCNQKKGARSLEDFLKGKPKVLARVRRELKTLLRDAAAVNATRWVLFNELKATGLPVETGSGALTKLNRHAFGVEKEHWLDALCVGRLNGVVTRKDSTSWRSDAWGGGAVNARASRSTASRAGT